MKKAILSLLLAVSSFVVMAQCFTPGPGSPGIYPISDDIPCVNQNIAYSSALTFQNFDSANTAGIQVRIEYLIIDSINNLPCGISWSTNMPDNKWLNQENGCIFFNGTTADPIGQYKLRISVRAKLNILPGEVPYDFESLGFRIDLRVKNNGGVCPAVDTTAGATLQTSSCNIGYLNTYFNTVRGKVYVDTDGNGSFNGSDYGLAGYRVNASANDHSFTNQNGDYLLYLPTGSYSVAPGANADYALSTSPAQYPFNFTVGGADYPGNNFGFTVLNTVNDLAVTVNNSFFRPGFAGSYLVSVTNLGTVVANSNVKLVFDTLFNVTGTTPTAANLSAGEATWVITNLLPSQTQNFTLHVTTPIDVNLLGDTVLAVATIDTTILDVDTEDNTFTNSAVISGAYDPNDKTPYPSVLSEDFVDENGFITYRIRFQNTGNDTAFNITVRDTIGSPHLDISTMQLLSASHEYTFRIEEGNIAIWEFQNILLPDSNVNEPGSHGYIFFRIKINNTNIVHGTEILNQAGIYFDFNPVVMTDPSVARADFTIGIREVAHRQGQISVYPNPATSIITIEHKAWASGSNFVLMDMTGKKVLSQPLTSNRTELNTSGLPNGVYLYRVTNANGTEGMGKIVVAK